MALNHRERREEEERARDGEERTGETEKRSRDKSIRDGEAVERTGRITRGNVKKTGVQEERKRERGERACAGKAKREAESGGLAGCSERCVPGDSVLPSLGPGPGPNPSLRPSPTDLKLWGKGEDGETSL